MKTRVLSKTEKEMFGADLMVSIDYNDVAAYTGTADNSGAPAPLFTAPKGFKVACVGVKLVNEVGFDFSDAGITSMTLKIGDGGDDDRFLTALQVAEDGTEIEYFAPAALTSAPYTYLADDTVDLIVTVANGGSPTLAECTSGEVILYFRLEDMNQLPNR